MAAEKAEQKRLAEEALANSRKRGYKGSGDPNSPLKSALARKVARSGSNISQKVESKWAE